MKLVSSTIHLTPTDLSNHLGCKHLTELNRLLAMQRIAKPSWTDPALTVLAQRGAEHEQAYVDALRANGKTVANLNGQGPSATFDAMKSGVDVIVQAELQDSGWNGRTDILYKVATPCDFGNWSYEVQDTKLSRNTRAGTILQLAVYSDMIGKMQGVHPEQMHVIKPGISAETPFDMESFRYADFKAYYQRTKNTLTDVIERGPQASYPYPVEQCHVCRWWKECDKKRHDDDHLSLVASIRSMHIGELEKQEIITLEQFAKRDHPLAVNPARGNNESYFKIHEQAKIQLQGRMENRLVYQLLPYDQGRGLSRLPQPSPGDIYFDIEGDPFYEALGLEYLFGYAFLNDKGQLEYEGAWATTRAEEKLAFGKFMSFVMERLKKNPGLHIYHFSPYEPSAIKRLSLRHTVHEADLDWLLRAERFIDLYAVVREGLRASVERYSLKDLERFTHYVRKVELPVASAARRTVEFALELNDRASLSSEILSTVEGYNADDCLATHALHQWLETLREDLARQQNDLHRPELKTGEANEKVAELDTRTKSLFNSLVTTLPEEPKAWSAMDHARWLLANQLDYFRRELKSAYWEYFYLHELSYEGALDERKAIAGLQYIGDAPLKPKEKTPIHRYSFPPQEIGLKEGDKLFEIMKDEIGSVNAISNEACVIEIKKTGKSKDIHPLCVHQKEVVGIDELANSLCDIANSVLEDGFESGTYRASKDLLLKKRPRLKDQPLANILNPGEDLVEGSIRIAMDLQRSVLGIQGPPGSGKTYTGAMMILQLAQAGKTIGLTAPSHKVIINLLIKIHELSAQLNIPVALMHKAKEGETLPAGIALAKDTKQALQGISDKKVVGGTAWLWSHNDARETLDYLFVDEAGQMSLAYVLAASRAAKNVILLGDPQQLEQPQKASHPEGADVAALSHLLDGQTTMPEEKGIFLGITRRLHPSITRFITEVFYDNRLRSMEGLERQGLNFTSTPSSLTGGKPGAFPAGAGLFYVPVVHDGKQNRSEEEVRAIAAIVERLTTTGVTWNSEKGRTVLITKEDILIVAPYNAQVAALAERLPGFRIGTVDKFQGQEAAVAIYSMTSSSAEEAPRGMSFLYNPNRLNVATSRAKCLCIIVASEKLFEADCRTVEQMRWINALCRYRELATTVYTD
jgi:predicted RecB family nuclease